MPNYKESKITGEITKYIRCSRGSFNNSNILIPNSSPNIIFNEDEITNLPNGDITINSNLSTCIAELIDPNETFNLLNPATDEVIGTTTYGDIFTYMYSLYRYASVKRDEQVIAEVPSTIPSPFWVAPPVLEVAPPESIVDQIPTPAVSPITIPIFDPPIAPPIVDPIIYPTIDPFVPLPVVDLPTEPPVV